ncbi:MAG: 30S ribosomal protein S20 [Candidatus Aquicultor sp.]|nr:30S ribosomal protein S20 [Candidatus Aquicultor sp.]
MANIKSQIKRIKVSERQRQRNKSAKSALKTFAAKFNSAWVSGDKDATASALYVAVKQFDRAAEKGIIHKNNAANKKSKMMKKLNSLGN